MKGIDRDLGERNIPLKPISNTIRQRPYRLNPKYKEKVKVELDKMLDVGIIEPVDESKWINPIVVQDKNTRRLGIYVDMRKLNDDFYMIRFQHHSQMRYWRM